MTYKAPVDQMSLVSVKNGINAESAKRFLTNPGFGNSRFHLGETNLTIPINIQVGGVSPYEVDPTQPMDGDNQYRADKYWIAQDPINPNMENPPPPIIRVVPYFTAIIQLIEGVVSGIVWDDGCYGCSSSAQDCVKGQCNCKTNLYWKTYFQTTMN